MLFFFCILGAMDCLQRQVTDCWFTLFRDYFPRQRCPVYVSNCHEVESWSRLAVVGLEEVPFLKASFEWIWQLLFPDFPALSGWSHGDMPSLRYDATLFGTKNLPSFDLPFACTISWAGDHEGPQETAIACHLNWSHRLGSRAKLLRMQSAPWRSVVLQWLRRGCITVCCIPYYFIGMSLVFFNVSSMPS